LVDLGKYRGIGLTFLDFGLKFANLSALIICGYLFDAKEESSQQQSLPERPDPV
jgi:hypothetical protein